MPENSMAEAADPSAQLSNWELIQRLFGLAWRYRMRCLHVLGLQLILLTFGLGGLGFTGLAIDYIRFVIATRAAVPGAPVPVLPHGKLGLNLPVDWQPVSVLMLIACCILALAISRAVLNYF